ncbi:Copia protein, partial [Trachymyrmex cornetzi]
ARCMMLQSGLPPSFWAEAVSAANYIRNRCVTRSLKKGTPYENWTGKKPNIGHLRTFGSKVFVLDKTPNKGKFDPRGIEGTFVGYAENAKAYRVWIPNENRIRITRDVRFLNGLESPSLYKDIITEETRNGRYEMLDDPKTTEIIQTVPKRDLHEFTHDDGEENRSEDGVDHERTRRWRRESL